MRSIQKPRGSIGTLAPIGATVLNTGGTYLVIAEESSHVFGTLLVCREIGGRYNGSILRHCTLIGRRDTVVLADGTALRTRQP